MTGSDLGRQLADESFDVWASHQRQPRLDVGEETQFVTKVVEKGADELDGRIDERLRLRPQPMIPGLAKEFQRRQKRAARRT